MWIGKKYTWKFFLGGGGEFELVQKRQINQHLCLCAVVEKQPHNEAENTFRRLLCLGFLHGNRRSVMLLRTPLTDAPGGRGGDGSIKL